VRGLQQKPGPGPFLAADPRPTHPPRGSPVLFCGPLPPLAAGATTTTRQPPASRQQLPGPLPLGTWYLVKLEVGHWALGMTDS
jgi:hypothetical protein